MFRASAERALCPVLDGYRRFGEGRWTSARRAAKARATPEKTPYPFDKDVEKNHVRQEERRCYVFGLLDLLHALERWFDLKFFAMLASERTLKVKCP